MKTIIISLIFLPALCFASSNSHLTISCEAVGGWSMACSVGFPAITKVNIDVYCEQQSNRMATRGESKKSGDTKVLHFTANIPAGKSSYTLNNIRLCAGDDYKYTKASFTTNGITYSANYHFHNYHNVWFRVFPKTQYDPCWILLHKSGSNGSGGVADTSTCLEPEA
ncbi:hypothetical protein [Dongshaea marina]|uniref:hypothetical protein n=1 Tax=Dongshaea marina TaxID=2047966 RepID=UPI000D3EAFBF|nr:hypothetical protein [Dongshaea marina]